MLYRTMNKTGEKVSVLGFGCMRLPFIDGNFTNIDDEKAIVMLRHAIDNGLNYVDTAYPYHGSSFETGGESELFVARALKDGYREKVNIATKLPTWLIHSPEDFDKYLNEQLERLETDHIDFYLLHAMNWEKWDNMNKQGFALFLDKALADGRIRHAGFSFHDEINLFKEIVDAYDWSFCLMQYNYIDENYQAGTEGLKYAANKGMNIMIMEPLRGGNLAKVPSEISKMFDSAPVKRTPVEWALRWLWNKPEVTTVLSGMSTMEQVEDNLRIASQAEANSLTPQELEIMDKAKDIYNEKLQVNCTGCGYCMPCPFGVNIPKNFGKLNDYYIFDDPASQKHCRFVYSFITSEDEKPSNCTECGECEEKCPQNIEIREALKQVKAVFEP